ARLEHDDVLAGLGEDVRHRRAARAAADDADVEAREPPVAENGVFGPAHSGHVMPSELLKGTTASSIACPLGPSGSGRRLPPGPTASGSGPVTGCPGRER